MSCPDCDLYYSFGFEKGIERGEEETRIYIESYYETIINDELEKQHRNLVYEKNVDLDDLKSTLDKIHDEKIQNLQSTIYKLQQQVKSLAQMNYDLRKEHEAIQKTIEKDFERRN